MHLERCPVLNHIGKKQEIDMNKDQIKGAAKVIGGKIQEEAGKLVGSRVQEAKGLEKQIEGKAQEHVGSLKEAVRDATKP